MAKAFGAQTLFTGVNLSVDRGDRVGLIGPNGSGKSTLLRILCGLEAADRGTVSLQKLARTAYVAQEDLFDEAANCADNLLAATTGLDLDEAERYSRVLAVLSRAHFDDPQQPVRELSGGWRKRLAVCRALVARPDVLIMDEPTNHLDIEGILWLENLLLAPSADGPAALLMVSHDRRFLDNVVTSTLAFEGDGQWREYEGDVQDWLTQSARSASLARASSATAPSSANTSETAAPISSTAATPPNPSEATKEKTPLRNVDKQVTPPKKKLSYKEQRELDTLPSLIDTLEKEQRTIDSLLATGQLYASDPAQAAKLSTRHAQIDDELLAALERLDALS